MAQTGCEICPSSCISRDAWGLLSCQDPARQCMPCHAAFQHDKRATTRRICRSHEIAAAQHLASLELTLRVACRRPSRRLGPPHSCHKTIYKSRGGPCRSSQAKLPTESPRLDITTLSRFFGCLLSKESESEYYAVLYYCILLQCRGSSALDLRIVSRSVR